MAAPASTLLICPQGDFRLQRYPRRKPETLQAWCGADMLLLEAADPASETLVVNDEHGALCVAVQPRLLWTDSALSVQAMRDNCAQNSRVVPAICWSTASPEGRFQQVLLRIPKQLAYFEYQLAQLADLLEPGTRLYLAGMDKHLSPHTADLIERYFGAVERHRGRRKARLFSAVQGSPGKDFTLDAYSRYHCPPLNGQLCALPNVFSRERLDIGTRFLLENLHRLPPATQVADLACGNGVLGIAALQQNGAATVTFLDESAMAIASARINCRALLGETKSIVFHHGDGFRGLAGHFDRILCNPPFHLSHTVDDFAGRRLLGQCANALNSGGELVLVANRHLPYGDTLQQSFGRVEQLARNNKFIIWRARSGC
ncbi:class I SAM-dependent methyltransferase [Pseudohalioglobus lutimaris]|uniref:Class I SAM-dependent methyltransferase n=1 Tax=Pseudohalioglobus lutimaris TaxID=1737061 RepID=A0A2N5X313_9GAMM|nr:class I SAM-dependent methyltransferase [Pseudohalioglobus lutimaris]PLW68886.1 class I SAM-dependent methyltransferase [Pseudohalioglobus lutimaris]